MDWRKTIAFNCTFLLNLSQCSEYVFPHDTYTEILTHNVMVLRNGAFINYLVETYTL